MSKQKISSKIEKIFENYTRLIFRNPVKTLLVMLIVFSAFAVHVPDIIIDTSVEEMLQKDDPKRIESRSLKLSKARWRRIISHKTNWQLLEE